jgi:hypothetical protein
MSSMEEIKLMKYGDLLAFAKTLGVLKNTSKRVIKA